MVTLQIFGFNSIQCHPLFNHNLQYIEKLKTKKCDNLDKKLKKEFGLIILQAKSSTKPTGGIVRSKYGYKKAEVEKEVSITHK